MNTNLNRHELLLALVARMSFISPNLPASELQIVNVWNALAKDFCYFKTDLKHGLKTQIVKQDSTVAPLSTAPDFQILDLSNWTHGCAWRTNVKRRRAPLLPKKKLAVDKLSKWCQQGINQAAVLENSAISNWQGLIKPEHNRSITIRATQRSSTLAGLTNTGDLYD